MQYKQATRKAKDIVRANYNGEIASLESELKNSSSNSTDKKRSKVISNRLKELELIIDEEAKPLIKEIFDYEIPIAVVQDAGITSTGEKTDNRELKQLQVEFYDYNKQAELWGVSNNKVTYRIDAEGKIFRISDGMEVQLVW